MVDVTQMIVLNALVPVFGLVFLGWYLGFRRVLPAEADKTLSLMTFRLFMPVLLFTGVARVDMAQAMSPALLPLYFLPAFLVFAGTNLLLSRDQPAGLGGLAASYSNNIMVGIPLVTVMLGAENLVYLYAIVVFHSLILFSLQSIYAAFFGKKDEAQSWGSLLKTLANPLIVALLLGAAFNLSGLRMPAPLWKIAEMLAGAALPMALLMLGFSLAGLRLYPRRSVWLPALGKLLVFPALVLIAGWLVPGLPDNAHAVLVLMAACPSGVNVIAFSATVDERRSTSSVIFLTTVVAAFTLPLWLMLVP